MQLSIKSFDFRHSVAAFLYTIITAHVVPHYTQTHWRSTVTGLRQSSTHRRWLYTTVHERTCGSWGVLGPIVEQQHSSPGDLQIRTRNVAHSDLRDVGSRPSDHYFRSVCLSVCLFLCLFVCVEFFSAVFDPISIKLGHVICLGLVVSPRILGLCNHWGLCDP